MYDQEAQMQAKQAYAGGQTGQPVRVSQVGNEMDQLEKGLEALDQIAHRFESRCSGYLRDGTPPAPPHPGGLNRIEPPIVAAAERVRAAHRRLEMISNHFAQICERLEV